MSDQPVKPTASPERIRRPVSPELAALVRAQDAALATAISTAQAMASAVTAAGNAHVAAVKARHNGVVQTILTQLGIETGTLVGTYGSGAATVLEIELPAPSTSEPSHA